MTTLINSKNDAVPNIEIDSAQLSRKFQAVAWGLFLIMSGILWLLPQNRLPDGLWFMGLGLILLGLNVVRVMNDLETSGLTVILGLLAISVGLSNLMEVTLPAFALLLIGVGSVMVLRSIFTRIVARQQPESGSGESTN